MEVKGHCVNPKAYGRFGYLGKRFRSGQPAFSKPTAKCLYIKILNILKDELLEEPTRRNIYKALGYGIYYDGSVNTNTCNCVWAGLKNANLINWKRVGRSIHYEITKQGLDYLDFYEL